MLMEEQHPARATALGVVLVAASLAQLRAAHAEPPSPAAPLAEEISGALEQYSKEGDLPLPPLAPSQLDTVIAGEPMVDVFAESSRKWSDRVDAMRVLGMQVVDAPRVSVWLSVLGRDDDASHRLTRTLLARMPAGAYVTYQRIDLPWPFKDRQWVILSEKNVDLADESHNLIWEHRWSLLPDGRQLIEMACDDGRIAGVTRETLDDSVYLAANRGAWILFDLGHGKTLVTGYVEVDFGGRFPDVLVHSFVKRQLRAALQSLKNPVRADDRNAPIVYDGRGLPISARIALDAELGADEPRLVKASAAGGLDE